jgi:hypothetical protein
MHLRENVFTFFVSKPNKTKFFNTNKNIESIVHVFFSQDHLGP